MKALIALVGIFLSACASKPPSPCSSLTPGCESRKTRIASGIGAERTVQFMVQSPMLIGGKPADPAAWPASVYAKSGSSACSATLVGERVLFMAAHCMPNGGQVSFNAGANQYKARCAHHPEYRKNDTADWAMCFVDRPVTGVPFEVLGIGAALKVAQSLLLSGYGCVKPGGGGGNDGIFRIGAAVIRGLPSGNNYDIVTRGGAALCFGDSGGAAYLLSEDGSRIIVGVNSRGDISTMSYLPAVFAGSFISWAKSWSASSGNAKICGVHSDAAGCRSSGPSPVDSKFEVTAKAACIKGAVSQEYLDRKDELVDTIRRTLENF